MSQDKSWLFEENIRLASERIRLEELQKSLDERESFIREQSARFIKERSQFRDEMNALTSAVTRERQRLKQDELFFDKKMDILKRGFAELEHDRRALEADKIRMEARESFYGDDDVPGFGAPIARALFKGISNPLLLKKRYKDLVKIYHPDNMAGDHELFKAITMEYERIQMKLYNEGIG